MKWLNWISMHKGSAVQDQPRGNSLVRSYTCSWIRKRARSEGAQRSLLPCLNTVNAIWVDRSAIALSHASSNES